MSQAAWFNHWWSNIIPVFTSIFSYIRIFIVFSKSNKFLCIRKMLAHTKWHKPHLSFYVCKKISIGFVLFTAFWQRFYLSVFRRTIWVLNIFKKIFKKHSSTKTTHKKNKIKIKQASKKMLSKTLNWLQKWSLPALKHVFRCFIMTDFILSCWCTFMVWRKSINLEEWRAYLKQ